MRLNERGQINHKNHQAFVSLVVRHRQGVAHSLPILQYRLKVKHSFIFI